MTDFDRKLGKIQYVSFGHGGYDDAMIGINFALGADGWGVGDFWGAWRAKCSDGPGYTKEDDRIMHIGEVVMRINSLLNDAKVSHIQDLVGKPVEVAFGPDGALRSWRILTEVI